MPAGCTVWLYDLPNFGGAALQLNASASCLDFQPYHAFNDVTSSIRINCPWSIPSPPPPPPPPSLCAPLQTGVLLGQADLLVLNSTTPDACCAACWDDVQCGGFSFLSLAGTSLSIGDCLLKGATLNWNFLYNQSNATASYIRPRCYSLCAT